MESSRKVARTDDRPGSPSGVDAPEAAAALSYSHGPLRPSELGEHRSATLRGVGGERARLTAEEQVQRKIADDAAYERSKRVEAAPLEYLSGVVSDDTIKVLERVHSENQKEEEDRPFWGAVESKRARDAFRDLLTVGTSDPPVYEAAHKELVKIVDAGNICLIVPAGAEEHPLILYLAANNDHRDWDLFLRLKEEGSDLVQGPEQVQAFERGAGRGAWKMLCEAAEAAAERKEARDMGVSEA